MGIQCFVTFKYFRNLIQDGKIQNGDTGNHQDIPPTREVGHLNRLQGRLLPYPYTGTVQEISEISCPGSDIQIKSSTFRSVHSTLGVYCSSKGGETDGHTQGYKDPPVPRRLVGESQIPPGLSPAYSRSSENMPGTRLAGEFGQVGTGTQADLRFCRLPDRPQGRSGPTHTGPVAEPSRQNTRNTVTTGLPSPAVHVSDRLTNSHRKASSPRPITHETYSVASQEQLAGTGIIRESDPYSQIPAPTLTMDKSELEPKQIFDFVGYQIDLKAGRVRPTPDRWQNLQDKILEILSLPACPVRQFMSLIGLLTATEKQVHLGRLHMRPIQWHLRNNWRVPESSEKVIPIPRSLHPHLQWWLEEDNVLTGQPLHPIQHALQIFTDASKQGWGAHLNEHTARGVWSLPESKLHINWHSVFFSCIYH